MILKLMTLNHVFVFDEGAAGCFMNIPMIMHPMEGLFFPRCG